MQKITLRIKGLPCTVGLPGDSYSRPYYEAWWVSRGDTVGQPVHDFSGPWRWNDQASMVEKYSIRLAVSTNEGEAKFFCESVTGNLGYLWPTGTPQAGGLPSTYFDPTWWSTAPSSGEVIAHRRVQADWTCCQNENNSRVSVKLW